MNKKKSSGTLPLLICIAVLAACWIGAEVLYTATKYLPFCLFGLICLMPALTLLTVVIFKLEIPLKDKPELVADGESTEDEKPQKGFKSAIKGIGVAILRAFGACARFYNKRRTVIASAVALAVNITLQIRFLIMLSRMTSIYTLSYTYLIAVLVVFIILLSVEKWTAHVSEEDRDEFFVAMKKNIRSVLILIRTALLLVGVSMALKLLGFYDAQNILRIVLAVFWYYASLFTIASFTVALIKKTLFTAPALNIPTPFSIGSSGFGLIAYLEENTGITMRSLWSIKMIKGLVPYTLLAIGLVFWLSTGIVQVESYEHAAVYRFGHLSEKLLEPGIHLTLPWPLDKVEKYDTETVKKLVIGYKSVEDTDNTWSGEHGTSEYRLLLGSVDELVSINLRIEYKISDLYKYVKSSSSPDKILEAQTYNLVTDKTIHTDLETLLTIDRNAFSTQFRQELTERVKIYDTGVEIVSVVLESIHPPIDVADVYQSIVSAEIEAEKIILEAEAYASTTVTKAEAQSYKDISQANADKYSKVADAEAAVAEFMAGVEADKAYPDSYRYYKYMSAITKAYGSAKLIIVGDGIDSSNIYFGNIGQVVTPQ
ncbi:MAG: protease modulator HflK [Clostridia bacterium]|nr:protease modulator HflK [Clostridia bacterium]